MNNYLKSCGVNIIDIEKASHNSSKFNSFRICVHRKDYYKVLKNPVWSTWGARCRPWKDRENNMPNNSFQANNYISSVNCDAWDRSSYNLNNGHYGN